jgi:hypothetical protein
MAELADFTHSSIVVLYAPCVLYDIKWDLRPLVADDFFEAQLTPFFFGAYT